MAAEGTHPKPDLSSPPCELCGGTGWKTVVDRTASGERRRVTRCDCQVELQLERRLAMARIPGRYEHCDFSNFETNIHDSSVSNQNLRAARFLAERFAQEYPAQGDFGLLFMGPCGVGKTHLAVAILRALASKGVECLFYDFRELLKQIQASYNPVSQTTEMQILTPVLESEVLLLDDLGAIKPSLWVLDTVGHIINSRYNDKRVTLITTNYLDAPAGGSASAGGLAESRKMGGEDTLADRIGERMRSRLYEMCRVVSIQADDFRRRVKQAQYHFS
jgi:DNA replication protein DnaC